MSELTTAGNAAIVERVVLQGDLAQLSPEDRIGYYRATCESLGLNPLTKPFEYIKLNNKLTLYAKKDATDQLRQLNGVSISEPKIDYIDDLIVVSVTATDKQGRTDADMGAVSIKGLQGDKRANAIMKAITKAKRRVTLSIVGLGWLDETEIETIPDVQIIESETVDGIPDPDPTQWLPDWKEFEAQITQDFKRPIDELKTVLKDHCGFTGFNRADATDMYNCLAEYFAPAKQSEQPQPVAA